ncbi:MAG TPA: MFS transporter [Caulobacteraceae bacterium]|jgi:PPP family 3-phenylpropionic acid transporter
MSIALRLGLYYASLFIGNGASGPYAGVWFKAHGLSGAAIGLILAAPSLGRVITGPSLAVWADGYSLRRTPIALLGIGVAAAFLCLALSRGFWAWLGLWFVSQSLFGACSPLADVIALRRARTEGFNYGFPRGIGSAAYIFANVTMGVVLGVTAPNALLVWVVAAGVASAIAAQWLLPPDPVHESGEYVAGRERWKGLGALVRDPVFVLAIVSTGLIQASHGFYYGFSALTWKAAGLPSGLVGVLWGVGVAAEVGFLWFMEPWRRRIGPERLVVLGGIGAVVRWTCLAASPPLWLLIPLQTLHAFSFTATFMGSLQLMERLAPDRSASLAQTLNSVLSGGLLIGLATMASGRLFDAAGAHGYLAMSLVALLGLVGALCLPALQRHRVLIARRETA